MRIKGYHLLPAAVLSAVLPFGSIAGAQDYPAKPVKIITQGAAGSGPDVIARLLPRSSAATGDSRS
jgi:tripartite-type tricarboxylate transporter receptor subunit TctC